jgi:hypothetical protein
MGNMTNIHTLPGLTPRLLPPKPSQNSGMDELRAQYTLSHFQIMMQCAQYIACNEGSDKAISSMQDIIDLLHMQKAANL